MLRVGEESRSDKVFSRRSAEVQIEAKIPRLSLRGHLQARYQQAQSPVRGLHDGGGLRRQGDGYHKGRDSCKHTFVKNIAEVAIAVQLLGVLDGPVKNLSERASLATSVCFATKARSHKPCSHKTSRPVTRSTASTS